jgi:hypothetical protein
MYRRGAYGAYAYGGHDGYHRPYYAYGGTIVRTTTEDTITTIEAEPQTRGCGVGFNCFDIVPIRVDSKPRLPREGCAGGVAAHLCHIDSVDRLTAVLRSPIGALVAAFSPLLIKQQSHHKNFF